MNCILSLTCSGVSLKGGGVAKAGVGKLGPAVGLKMKTCVRASGENAATLCKVGKKRAIVAIVFKAFT